MARVLDLTQEMMTFMDEHKKHKGKKKNKSSKKEFFKKFCVFKNFFGENFAGH